MIPQSPELYSSDSALRVVQDSEQTMRQREKSTRAQETEGRKII